MSKLDRVLVPGSTEVPNCRCGTETHLIALRVLIPPGFVLISKPPPASLLGIVAAQ
jgi:hypothetical protein